MRHRRKSNEADIGGKGKCDGEVQLGPFDDDDAARDVFGGWG